MSVSDDDENPLKAETLLVTAGRDTKAQKGFVNPPVVHGSTVLYPTAEDLHAHRGEYQYGRRGTPTTKALQEALMALEGPSCVGVGLVPVLWAAGEPWVDKPAAQWSDSEARQVINDSPWAKKVDTQYEGKSSGGGALSGISFPGSGGGMGRGGGGYPGGGGGYPGDCHALHHRWFECAVCIGPPVAQVTHRAPSRGQER